MQMAGDSPQTHNRTSMHLYGEPVKLQEPRERQTPPLRSRASPPMIRPSTKT